MSSHLTLRGKKTNKIQKETKVKLKWYPVLKQPSLHRGLAQRPLILLYLLGYQTKAGSQFLPPDIQIRICCARAVFLTQFFTFLEAHSLIKPGRRCIGQFQPSVLQEPISITAIQWSPSNTPISPIH
jgi:hypothetical protein